MMLAAHERGGSFPPLLPGLRRDRTVGQSSKHPNTEPMAGQSLTPNMPTWLGRLSDGACRIVACSAPPRSRDLS